MATPEGSECESVNRPGRSTVPRVPPHAGRDEAHVSHVLHEVVVGDRLARLVREDLLDAPTLTRRVRQDRRRGRRDRPAPDLAAPMRCHEPRERRHSRRVDRHVVTQPIDDHEHEVPRERWSERQWHPHHGGRRRRNDEAEDQDDDRYDKRDRTKKGFLLRFESGTLYHAKHGRHLNAMSTTRYRDIRQSIGIRQLLGQLAPTSWNAQLR